VTILSLANATFGPVRGVLTIMNVGRTHEGIYLCADPDFDVRQSEGCLFVLGKTWRQSIRLS
jgi:hypothetical protein